MSVDCQLNAGGLRWQVQEQCREQLLGPDGLRLEEWLRDGRAAVVKHGPHRTVYRVRLRGIDFYLKHYRLHDTRAWLRELVRPSKARMEFERAVAVAGRGVPTVEPLLVGERRFGAGPGDSFLATRTLDAGQPLSNFLETELPRLPATRQTAIRQRTAVALGAFIARLHDAGVVHPDLHAGNLLLRLDAGDRPLLYLIDLHAVSLHRPLTWEASRANLVILNHWFSMRASRSDRLRFWRTYRNARKAGVSASALPQTLERLTWESNLAFWRSRDRRSLANNRYYHRVRAGSVAGHAVRDLDADALAALLADPDEPFRRPGVVLLKNSRSSTVAELELPLNGVPRRVIWKRFAVTAWSDPWAALVRPTAALRSWVFGHGLRERCLPTPRPLAVLHRRRRGLRAEGYLLTEKVPDAVELQRFVAGLNALPAAKRRTVLRRALDQLAALIRELHRRGLSHRDLKAPNVLVSPVSSGQSAICNLQSAIQFWLIDLVGVRRHGKVPWLRRVQNLARLHASFLHNSALTRTDKLRFLRVYLQWGLFGRDRWKRWWLAVERATRAKVARNARSGRLLA